MTDVISHWTDNFVSTSVDQAHKDVGRQSWYAIVQSLPLSWPVKDKPKQAPAIDGVSFEFTKRMCCDRCIMPSKAKLLNMIPPSWCIYQGE